MATVREHPAPTETVSDLALFAPTPGSAYVFGVSGEERADRSPDWLSRSEDVRVVRIHEQRSASEPFSFDATIDEGAPKEFRLRSQNDLRGFWSAIDRGVVYLDITGLSHHVWAPLVQSGLRLSKQLKAVYVEPTSYAWSTSPAGGDLFDLSERIRGIAPLPGFASLVESDDEFVFVPLLGFEGARLAYLVEHVQPVGNAIFPVIGVPGFRLEYPFYTYLSNRVTLEETKAWRRVRYARANCPFSLIHALSDISEEMGGRAMKIGLIGTKPHALGAVLFHMMNQRSVELVYDHPIRKRTRTAGAERVLVYHLPELSRG